MPEEVISSSFSQNQDGEACNNNNNLPPLKKKRNLPGTPDPEAEVIALSPKTLMATNRFLCEICGKGFQRDQNLQLHRRGHNLPWKLKQRTSKEVRKRVYVCPEKSCVHHHASRALGDLTGIKKHFCRKHGEKKWKCEKCAKRYAVQSDWKAHSKTCGTREYKCSCGTIFSRRDSFITHRAFCDALAEETARVTAASNVVAANNNMMNYHFVGASMGQHQQQHFSSTFKPIITTSCSAADESTNPIRQQQGLLPLWMGGHGINLQEKVPNNINLQEIPHHQLIFPTDQSFVPPNYQLNWDFGNKNSEDQLAKVKDHHHQIQMEMVTTVPSLFSTQHQSHQTHSAANMMSATALLQKAAQIGATTSDHSLFLGSSAGLYGTTTTTTTTSANLNQLQMYPLPPPPSSKRRRITDQDTATGGGGSGHTRDFLGVGVQSICHPSSINGWI